jgi:acetyl esterase/lipase
MEHIVHLQIFLLLLFCGASHAQPNSAAPETLLGADSRLYKTIGDTQLRLRIYQPTNRKQGDKLPAIVFFFGGGWRNRTPAQFVEHCKYLASRGMVAITAEYRVKSRHNVTPLECIADAKIRPALGAQEGKRTRP